jgi:hypothetical protein
MLEAVVREVPDDTPIHSDDGNGSNDSDMCFMWREAAGRPRDTRVRVAVVVMLGGVERWWLGWRDVRELNQSLTSEYRSAPMQRCPSGAAP